MNLSKALCFSVLGAMLAACESRVDPPPAAVHQPAGKITPAAATPTTPSTPAAPAAPSPAPVVETPVPPSPKPPDPALLLKLAEDLKSPDGKVRLESAARLSAFGPDAAPALPTLMENIRNKEFAVRAISSQVLIAIGTPAVPFLIEALKHRAWSARKHAAGIVERMGPKAAAAAPALIARLGGVDELGPELFIHALVGIGEPGVPALIEGYTRGSANVRQDVLLVIMRLGPAAKGALPMLKAAAEKDPRSWEGEAYSKINAQTQPLSEIAAELSHEDPNIRDKAAMEIEILGPKAKEALPALMVALQRQDMRNPLHAAIRAVGPDAILPLMAVMESAQEELVVGRAASLLATFDLPAEFAPRLTAMLLVPDGLRVAGVFRILEKMGPNAADAIPTVVSLLNSPRDSARQEALRFLGEFASALAPFLKDPDPAVRLRTLEALKKLGPKALPAKRSIKDLLKDPIPSVRSSAEEILKQLDRTN